MVLFTEAETTLLLDLYLHLRTTPQNVTSNGVLLRVNARDELTRAMNKSAQDRGSPWTGAACVCVHYGRLLRPTTLTPRALYAMDREPNLRQV